MKKIIGIIIAITVLGSLCLTGCGEEKKAAQDAFNAEVTRIQEEQAALTAVVEECEAKILAAEKPYDADTLTNLETVTSKIRAGITELPEMPSKIEDINALVEELKQTSYVENKEELSKVMDEYDRSVRIMKQVTNPSEEFVISALEKIEGIEGISAATEDNDPNGKLHKQGGYTAAVYFAYDAVDKSKLFGDTIIDQGTDAGGQIEVYETEEDAVKREAYLAGFDGGILSSGSHTVVGTMVVRTSNLMTASQQNDLENKIIDVLTTLVD